MHALHLRSRTIYWWVWVWWNLIIVLSLLPAVSRTYVEKAKTHTALLHPLKLDAYGNGEEGRSEKCSLFYRATRDVTEEASLFTLHVLIRVVCMSAIRFRARKEYEINPFLSQHQQVQLALIVNQQAQPSAAKVISRVQCAWVISRECPCSI